MDVRSKIGYFFICAILSVFCFFRKDQDISMYPFMPIYFPFPVAITESVKSEMIAYEAPPSNCGSSACLSRKSMAAAEASLFKSRRRSGGSVGD